MPLLRNLTKKGVCFGVVKDIKRFIGPRKLSLSYKSSSNFGQNYLGMVASLKLMKNFAIGAPYCTEKIFFSEFFYTHSKKNYESFYSFASTSRRELLVIFMATRASERACLQAKEFLKWPKLFRKGPKTHYN